jgi:hypothetical protein
LKQEWQKSPALGQGKQKEKLGLVGRIRKKISQIINAYLYLPFFLLIILWLGQALPGTQWGEKVSENKAS